MKKVLFFASCAAFVAAMTISCNSNKPEEVVEDTIVEDTIEVVEEEVVEATAEASTATMSDAEHAAMMSAAREAGQAKCNCYKTDAASVEACIKSILAEQYAAYKDNAEFKAEMEREFNTCVKEKVANATKEVANKAINEGAKALAGKLNKNN